MNTALSQLVNRVETANNAASLTVKCANRQCGHIIAFINGPVYRITCDKCGKVRKIYTNAPKKDMRLTIRFA